MDESADHPALEDTALTPEMIFYAYCNGVFPMGESGIDGQVVWVEPRMRGIIPLDGLHVSRSLRKTLRRGTFQVTLNQHFAGVIDGCAETAPGRGDRDETWINAPIRDVYVRLHHMGYAHSIECWQGGQLVGGLYGLALGGAFFGESMFSRLSDASKIALCHLVARLKSGGFVLLDTQFTTDHLESMGAIEIPQANYLERLAPALSVPDAYIPPNLDNDLVLKILDGSASPPKLNSL